MVLLAIDCAGGRLAVLLWREGMVRAVAAEQGARPPAARLPLLAADLLARAAVAPDALGAVAVATGGSTNIALHLPAIAHEAGIKLTLDDIERISRRTPTIADLKPGGR
ncbi:MAG: dihydroxy-acid dehydratase, partial [Acetobacteraceae bacterium]